MGQPEIPAPDTTGFIGPDLAGVQIPVPTDPMKSVVALPTQDYGPAAVGKWGPGGIPAPVGPSWQDQIWAAQHPEYSIPGRGAY